jgi:hypothetical protein
MARKLAPMLSLLLWYEWPRALLQDWGYLVAHIRVYVARIRSRRREHVLYPNGYLATSAQDHNWSLYLKGHYSSSQR